MVTHRRHPQALALPGLSISPGSLQEASVTVVPGGALLARQSTSLRVSFRLGPAGLPREAGVLVTLPGQLDASAVSFVADVDGLHGTAPCTSLSSRLALGSRPCVSRQ